MSKPMTRPPKVPRGWMRVTSGQIRVGDKGQDPDSGRWVTVDPQRAQYLVTQVFFKVIRRRPRGRGAR